MTRRTETFRRGSLRLSYEVAGEGPLVVFLHGVGGNRSNWYGELDGKLSEEYCCVALDARGYGDSDDPVGPLAFEDFSDDLESLLDHLGAESAHLVGLSMGGYIAQSFYLRHAARVATLTLAATSAGAGLLDGGEQEEFLAKRLRPLEAGMSMRDIAPALVEVLAGGRADSVVRQQLRASLEALRPEPYKAALRALVKTDFRPQLHRIRVPTLVIVGTDDQVLPEHHSRYLAEHIVGSRLVVIPDAGHLCNIEAPVEFGNALTEFLATHAADASKHSLVRDSG